MGGAADGARLLFAVSPLPEPESLRDLGDSRRAFGDRPQLLSLPFLTAGKKPH
jgi:hypothetical protein